MNQKQINNIITNLVSRAKKVQRKCLYHNCNDNSIQSHLLQKRGIINQIAENNHVYELQFSPHKKNRHYFNRVGVNEAFAFPGFCSKHDDQLFKKIESGSIDYSNYETQLLFSYRAAMNEKRKKEIIVDHQNRILNSLTLQTYLPETYFDYIRESIRGNQMGIKDELYYENIFLNNITGSLKDFRFHTYELPKIEVCASAVFTYETSNEINQMSIYDPWKESKPLTQIYFNLLPIEDKSIIIFGCLENRADVCWEYLKSFDTGSNEKSIKMIGDLFLCQIENWLCSPNMYRTVLKKKEKDISRIVQESNGHLNERRKLSFNLFD